MRERTPNGQASGYPDFSTKDLPMNTSALTQSSEAPSFKTAFLGFFGSFAFMTTAMVLLGSVGA